MQWWIEALAEQTENPLVRLVGEGLVRAIARRVRRGRPAAATRSEPGPAPYAEGTEAPVTVTEDRTGEQLAEELLCGVGNERMRAATRLLGAHRGGYWLRRLMEEELEHGSVIDRGGAHPSVDWHVLEHLMLTQPGALTSSTSEWTMLEIAVSLAASYEVQLGDLVQGVSEDEVRMILRALEQAAFGDAR
ncbi:hypothetical protein V2J94_37020 [Streptomyces sp. DSM 41524]|uniref:TetR family transcriptional regulator n=1 Tax=Streptomyces asiaticus subsp. ignotus TaxID=3098222 RepID=A0ABU7Q7S6_9ACTN|nr:hypothetical protein [Streptomyces sp. DSM 41524]